ncbi:LptF/LptG family permease [Luteolibacter sp. AS25]|uniref:LptF/LptG family permease n=1 Tax=Luteolibacter sp. AS25 TaxID=3135776 RepID=UPI00398B1D5B
MRLYDRYIAKQILVGTLYAIVVLSLVLVMGNLFKEARPLLVEQRAPLGLVLRFVINVLPFSLMFTIPWGFLSAVLLVFGRMSSDQELTAFRVAGISLVRLALPVFIIGAMLSGICMYINVKVVPMARASLIEIIYEQVKRDPRSLLNPGIVQSKFENQKLFVERREGDSLAGFHLYQISGGEDGKPGRADAYIHAGKVSLVVDDSKKQLRLKLIDTFIETKAKDGTPELAFAAEAEPWLFDFSSQRTKKVKSGAMTNAEIKSYLKAHPELTNEKKVSFRSEIRKRYSFSMACLAFASVAVPLGMTSRRKDTSTGLVLSLLIGLAYFVCTVMAEEFETDMAALIGLWAPNVFCVLLGLFLFRRARFR